MPEFYTTQFQAGLGMVEECRSFLELWEWASGAKVSGIKEESDAANFAISHLFDHWSCDVTKEDYQVYTEF